MVEIRLEVYRRDRSMGRTVSLGLLRKAMTTGGMIKTEEVLCDTSLRFELYSVCYFHPRPRGLVILVHSFQERSGQYEFLVRALWHAKFSVYLFDWRRQRRSQNEWPDLAHMANVEELLEDLKLTIGQARSREVNCKIFVLGNYIGAAVAVLYSASIDRSKVASIVVFTPALIPPVAHTCIGSFTSLLSVVWRRWKMKVERKGTLDEMFVRTVRSCRHLCHEHVIKPKDLSIPLLVMCRGQDPIKGWKL